MMFQEFASKADTIMSIIGVATAIFGVISVVVSIWFAGMRERRIYRDQRSSFERMLRQHAFNERNKAN